MLSQNRIDANRRNAASSTGPRTQEGKARSSSNSTQHGYYAQDDVIPALGETGEDYDRDLARWHQSLQPEGELELSALKQIVSRDRQLSRFRTFFAGYMDKMGEKQAEAMTIKDGTMLPLVQTSDQLAGLAFERGLKTLECHSRLENRTFNQYFKAVKLLTSLQQARASQPNVGSEPKQDSTPSESTSAPSNQQSQTELRPSGSGDELRLTLKVQPITTEKESEATNVAAENIIK